MCHNCTVQIALEGWKGAVPGLDQAAVGSSKYVAIDVFRGQKCSVVSEKQKDNGFAYLLEVKGHRSL